MVHLQNKSYTPKDAAVLLEKARSVVDPEVVVRDARVSRKYVEFDTSIPDSMDSTELTGWLAKLSPVVSCEQIVERQMSKNEAIRHAIELFNEEKYWGAHESLEGVWKHEKGIEKSILNGIILVAAAFVHDEKDEPEICISILQRAKKKLEGTGGTYHEIDIDRICDLISGIIESGRIERFTI